MGFSCSGEDWFERILDQRRQVPSARLCFGGAHCVNHNAVQAIIFTVSGKEQLCLGALS